MSKDSRKNGNAGEDFAVCELEKNGHRILCRNFKGAHGEIDIIAEKNSYILFIEVKLRKILSEKPAAAVDNKKLQHIISTADEFLCEFKDNNYISSLSPRFDIFEVYSSGKSIIGFNHIENIIL